MFFLFNPNFPPLLPLSLSVGLLIQLLHCLPSHLKQRRDTLSCGVQTDEEDEAKTINEKRIEEEEEEERKVTLEKRMIAFQKSCEARNKKTIEQEVHIN